jgi:uncharacterized protein (TIRG00374 family)
MIRRLALLFLGLLIAGILGWQVLIRVDFSAFKPVLETRSGLTQVALGVLCLAAGYLIRVLRWEFLLRQAGVPIRPLQSSPAFLSSFAINNLLPFRLGDIARVALAKKMFGAPIGATTATVMIERVLDGVVLVIFAIFGALLLPGVLDPDAAMILAGFAVVILLLIPLLIAIAGRAIDFAKRRFGAAPRAIVAALNFAGTVIDAFRSVGSPSTLLRAMVASVAAWVCEGVVVYFASQALQGTATMLLSTLSMALANLATLVPGAPGHFGTFHYFLMLGARAGGMAEAPAAALAVLAHAMVWLPVTVAGLLFLAVASIRQTSRLRATVGYVRQGRIEPACKKN